MESIFGGQQFQYVATMMAVKFTLLYGVIDKVEQELIIARSYDQALDIANKYIHAIYPITDGYSGHKVVLALRENAIRGVS